MPVVDPEASLTSHWTEEEELFDLDLEKFGIEIDETARVRQRKFKNYMEDWEAVAIKRRRQIHEGVELLSLNND